MTEESTSRSEALLRLCRALEDFLQTGLMSEGSADPSPHAGMDPNELDIATVERGGDVHNSVCAVQPFYGGQLPAPHALNAWRLLQWNCRHEADKFARQNDAHSYADMLLGNVKLEMPASSREWAGGLEATAGVFE